MSRRRKKLKAQPMPEVANAIKVRLDHRTVITLSSIKALDFWKARYPNATIVSE